MKIQYSGHQTVPLAGQQDPLTDDQKQVLQEILSRYQPENFSTRDQNALRQDMKEAKIPRTPETENILRKQGFIRQPPADTKKMTSYTDQQQNQLITPHILSLFKQHTQGELTDQQFQAQLEQMRQQFPKLSGNLVNKPV